MSTVENDYRTLGKLGEGTFAQVLRMGHKTSGKTYAMKRFKKRFQSFEEVNCLREVQALRLLNPHPNIVTLEDILFEANSGMLYLAFELMDCSLYDVISKAGVTTNETTVALWFFQIFKGLEYMHERGIFHRDIKPENILISDNVVKLADFGSCRGVYSRQPYTEYIATRWYRAPEVLLGCGYNSKMDIFASGCVLFETLTKKPIFPGVDTLDMLKRIHDILSSPSVATLDRMLGSKQPKFNFPETKGRSIKNLLPPFISEECVLFLESLLRYDPAERVSATQALQHPFFSDIPLSKLPLSHLECYTSPSTSPPNSSSSVVSASTNNKMPPLLPSRSKSHIPVPLPQPRPSYLKLQHSDPSIIPVLTSANGSSPASHLPHYPSFIPRRVDDSSMHHHNHLQSQSLQSEHQRDSNKTNYSTTHHINLPVVPHASSLTKTSLVSPEQTSFRLPSISFSANSYTHANSNSPNPKQVMSKQTSKQLASHKVPLLVPYQNTRTSQSFNRRDKFSNASASTISTLSNSYHLTFHNPQQQESATHIPRLSDIVLNPKMPSDLTVGLQSILTANSLSSPHKSPLQPVESPKKVKQPEKAYAGIIFRGKLMEDADDTKPMNLTAGSLIPDRIDTGKSNVKGRKPVGLLKP